MALTGQFSADDNWNVIFRKVPRVTFQISALNKLSVKNKLLRVLLFPKHRSWPHRIFSKVEIVDKWRRFTFWNFCWNCIVAMATCVLIRTIVEGKFTRKKSHEAEAQHFKPFWTKSLIFGWGSMPDNQTATFLFASHLVKPLTQVTDCACMHVPVWCNVLNLRILYCVQS